MEIESDCDDFSEPIIYSGEVATILTTKCSYSPCHDGSGAAPGDYRAYSGLLFVTGNGRFTDRVLEAKDMPIPGETPETLLLDDDELKMLRCWMENDFKEQ